MRADAPFCRSAAIGLAFAAGCLPGARLVTRFVRGASIDDLGDGKPGASNVYRTLGRGPGAAVLTIDGAKAFVPAAALKAAGASEAVVAAAAAAPVVAHVTVVGGQGAAAALGAAFALDAPATLVAIVPILAGTKAGFHPQGVLAGALVFPLARGLLRRRWSAALHGAVLPAILIAARLRGSANGGAPRSVRVAFNRLLIDRDA